MPKKRNIGSNGENEVTSADLAERFRSEAAEQGIELRSGEIYGANLGDLLRPGERLHSNRRAFFEEPDQRTKDRLSKDMEDFDRMKRALDAAGTDPQKRDEILWMIAGQNILHYMTAQSFLASANGPASGQQEAPAPESASYQKDTLSVAEFAKRIDMDPNVVREHCRSGRILAHHSKDGGKWRIPQEELEHFKREGLREPTWKRRR